MKRLMAVLLTLVLVAGASLPVLAAGGRQYRQVSSYGTTRDSYRSSRRNSYDQYGRRDGRSFWEKHRDKLTVGAGTVGGAILGGLIGGKRGAGIGALAGGGGAAVYTYKVRNKDRRY